MKKRINTGIPGFDDLLNGGFLEGSITLISGPPGIGKSTMAMQYIYKGIVENDEPGVFLTTENNIDEVISYADAFGWDFNKYMEEQKLEILDRSVFEAADMDLGLDFGIMKDIIAKVKAKRAVLDSVTLFNYMFRDDTSRRFHMLRFIDLMKKHNCTTLMTSDQEKNFPNIKYSEEHFLSDGLIFLFWNRHQAENERCIWAAKLKGSTIDTNIRPIEIADKGVIVYPEKTPLISLDVL
ncbi:MAG: ATPase domain-containing protein [Candidatus Altiarchaeota archaeon]|nr:ATPase domain-containing protein [Candidatus Altiarchaeota archaeon]